MPLTEGIVAGLLANGLTEVIRYLSPDFSNRATTRQPMVEVLREDKILEASLRKAMAGVAKATRLQDQKITEKLQMFLISPDAEAIVRQIFGLWLIPEARMKAEPELRREFTLLVAIHLGVESSDIGELADQIFETLLMGCDLALKNVIARGVLLAHEAKSERRFRLLSDELSAIGRNLEFLGHHVKPNVEDIIVFEEKYRRQLIDRHGHITPPHFDVSRKIPVKEICVPARLYQSSKRNETPTILNYEEFLSGFYRAVILGNPGGGKSTLASKLCFDLASDYKKRLLGGRQVTPILVILRDYGSAKKQKPMSIVQFMEMVSNSNYQIPAPHHSFEYMLLNGRAVVVFDGLDELLDTSYRQEISSDIDSFCSLYPSVPTLVTSREVGYEQAPLDKKKFSVFRLAPFDEKQVKQYVNKWFAADPDLPAWQQREKATAFLQESTIVSDLRSNPLMLALMCNIYRGENYIPRNRPDVYEKCALMLFEKWDKSRGIFVPLPFEAHISPAMKFLAYWIYSEEKLQGGVSEQRLISKAADYLCQWRYEDRAEAEKAARDFIDFCTGRAWVFTDTGTTREGDKLYQFTHRTFLEYFTAAHLVRIHPTPAEMGDALIRKIAKREWDVVAQLAYQLQNKQVEGAGDRLLSEIVNEAQKASTDDGRNLLSFAARCLDFIVPSPKIVRDITAACVNRALTRPAKDQSIHYPPTSSIGQLLLATDENRGPLSDSMEKTLVSRIESVTRLTSSDALILAARLPWTVEGTMQIDRAFSERWGQFSHKIVNDCSTKVRELAPMQIEVALVGYGFDTINLTEILSWYGSRGLFTDFSYWLFPNMFGTCIAHQLVMRAVSGLRRITPEYSMERLSEELSESGRYLLAAQTPWFSTADHSPYLGYEAIFDPPSSYDRIPEMMTFHGDALFGAFALIVGILEGSKDKTDLDAFCKSVRRSRLPFFEQLGVIFLSRFDRAANAVVEGQLVASRFSEKQLAFVRAWTEGKLALAERNK